MAPRSKQLDRSAGPEFEILPPKPSRHLSIGGERIPVFDLIDVELEQLPRAQALLAEFTANRRPSTAPAMKQAMVEYLTIVAPTLTVEAAEKGLRTVRQLTDVLAFLMSEAEAGADPLAESRQSETSSAKAA